MGRTGWPDTAGGLCSVAGAAAASGAAGSADSMGGAAGAAFLHQQSDGIASGAPPWAIGRAQGRTFDSVDLPALVVTPRARCSEQGRAAEALVGRVRPERS